MSLPAAVPAPSGAGAAPRRKRAPRGQGDRLRDEILEAAEDLLVRAGDWGAVSVRAVADAVGVSPPSLYLHFADKAQLVFAVCERHFEELDRILEAATGGIEDAGEALRARGRAYVGFALERPETYRILFMLPPTDSPPEWLHARLLESPSFQHLLAAVERAQAAGAVQPGSPQRAALGLWAATHGLASLFVAKPDLFDGHRDGLVEYLLDVLLAGVAAVPPG